MSFQAIPLHVGEIGRISLSHASERTGSSQPSTLQNRLLEAVLVGTVTICSGLIAWYEFRANNAEETEYGEWTGKAALYATIFGITLFLSFLFIPVAFFDP